MNTTNGQPISNNCTETTHSRRALTTILQCAVKLLIYEMGKFLTACVLTMGFLSCSYFVDPLENGADAQRLPDAEIAPDSRNIPDANVPDVDIPDADAPDVDIPDANILDANFPDVDTPDANVPDANLPDANLPDAIIPYVPSLRINEISADTNPDQSAFTTDWVEIKNISEANVNLEGYHLTDSANNLSKYTFPPLVLGPGAYLVIQLTNDEFPPAGLVAPFSLSNEGEYLALIDPDGSTIVSEFRPYPKQRYAHSFGIDETETDSTYGYFTTPTPGQRNEGTLYAGITQRVQHTVRRGFYEDAFDLLLVSIDGGQIYYTLDGSSPSPETGLPFTDTLTIDSTTVVRSIATKDGFLPSDKNAHTYIFPADVLNQPALPEGFPAEWQPGAAAHYAVDSSVAARADLLTSLRSYPSLSLTMPIDDWFNPSTDPSVGGIYSNSVDARGFDWERVVSAEFFDFEHGQEIQVEAGIRIFGNASRLISRPKHNMRLIFRKEHGPGKLKFPLFGDDDIDESVNGYLLRGGNGDSWFHPSAAQQEKALYIRDQLSRELHNRLNGTEVPQSHVHLYINGLYWGLFHTIERIEASSMAAKHGGLEADWDIVKASRRDGMQIVDGNLDSWATLQALSVDVANGVKDISELEAVLDLRHMANYLLLNFYGGNRDWDDNNIQAAKRRTGEDRWRFFQWDSENVFKSETQDVTASNHEDRVTAMHQRLLVNPTYRNIFQERIDALLKNDGLLTVGQMKATFERWVEKQRVPILIEAARWQAAHREADETPVLTLWDAEVARMLNSHIENRTALTLQQLAAHGFDVD